MGLGPDWFNQGIQAGALSNRKLGVASRADARSGTWLDHEIKKGRYDGAGAEGMLIDLAKTLKESRDRTGAYVLGVDLFAETLPRHG